MTLSDPEKPLIKHLLHRQLKDKLSTSIGAMRPGDRLPTEKELSLTFGVSIWTVRRAMDALEKEGCLERRQGAGTFVSSGGGVPATHIAVLLNTSIADQRLSPFFPRYLMEICAALREMGVAARPYLGTEHLGGDRTKIACPELLEDLELGRLRALLHFHLQPDPSWTGLFRQKRVPIQGGDLFEKGENDLFYLSWVKEALQILKAKGRKKIAVIGWENSLEDRHPLSKALARFAPEFGMEIKPDHMDLDANGWETGMGWERFRDIWVRHAEKPDAIIVADDMIFPDVQRAILELKIDVPRALDVMVLNSSDALNLRSEFPVRVWKRLVQPLAKIYAERVKALAEGSEPPPVTTVPYTVEAIGEHGEAKPDAPAAV